MPSGNDSGDFGNNSDMGNVRFRAHVTAPTRSELPRASSVIACQPRCRKIGSISVQVRRMAIASVSSSNLWPGRSRTRSA